jgi:hypothetical protein
MIKNNAEHTEDTHARIIGQNRILKLVTHAHEDKSM